MRVLRKGGGETIEGKVRGQEGDASDSTKAHKSDSVRFDRGKEKKLGGPSVRPKIFFPPGEIRVELFTDPGRVRMPGLGLGRRI